MVMRKFFSGAMMALVFLLAITAPAFAQDPNRLTQLKISVWPEYDNSSVLVILEGTLTDSTNLPREISILLPSKASLIAATWKNVAGTPAAEETVKTTDQGDGFTRLTWTVRTPRVYLEYYDDLLKGAPDKAMNFAFKSDASIDAVTLEVQQPLKASNFVLTPPTTTSRTDADGFKYYSYQLLNVTAGQIVAAQVKYTKTDPSPSIQATTSAQPQATGAPSASSTATSTPSSNDSILLLVGLVSLGLVGILGFFLYQRRARAAEETTAQKMSPRQFQQQRRRARGTENASVFCTKCGSPMDIDDNFCPKCGVKRRAV